MIKFLVNFYLFFLYQIECENYKFQKFVIFNFILFKIKALHNNVFYLSFKNCIKFYGKRHEINCVKKIFFF